MRLDELTVSLQTFEINLYQNKKQKEKNENGIALKKENGSAFEAEVKEVDFDDGEDLAESIARLSKNFNKVMKNMYRKGITPNYSDANNSQKNKAATSNLEAKMKKRGIQC